MATAIVTYAALVRAQGLFYILVELFVIVTYMKKGNAKFKVKAFILVVGIAVGMLIPLWIRNWRCFGGFYVLTKAGDGPKIWGAQPFFLDMASTNDKELSDLIRINAAANKQTYWNWRIFGFFNYMWYDIWDELLVHACDYLRDLRLVHPLIVVPVITLIPILLRKSRMEVLFLASFPIAFSLMCMPYHGLARYVFPSIPFVFILLGILLSKIVDFLRGREGRTSEAYVISSGSSNGYSYLWIRRVFESAYGVIAVIFSGILVYSVFFYSWDIDEEMSSFRIGRTYGVTIEDVQDMEVIQEVQLNAAEGMWNIGNVVDQPDGSYQGMPDVTPIIDAVIPQMPEDPGAGVISKVELVIPGGYWFDKCTVYWTGHRTETISENTVYSMPRSRFSDKITVYIDDNIDTLMIVPCVFRDSEFRIESIRVTKYLVQ